MDSPRNSEEMRLARILLPASVLREVDELVLAGRGGYRTRQEFFYEAIQNHVLEVKHGPIEDGDPPATSTRLWEGADPPANRVAEPSTAYRTAVGWSLSDTALKVPPRGVTILDGIARVEAEPLFGLHNRDFPSIWSACLLAGHTQHALVTWEGFLESVTKEAWRYAELLQDLETTTKTKLTALYPTNMRKKQSAEEGFRAFAIGVVARRPSGDGTVAAHGPLFCWGVCQLKRDADRLMIGLTEAGHDLLRSLEGLSLEQPHDEERAERFLTYLRCHAPSDWRGFEVLLDAAAKCPNRIELTEHFKQNWAEWSESVASTNAAGYVARAREWGLLEPKVTNSRYTLTKFGEEQREKGGER